jgi:hypothetical protein
MENREMAELVRSFASPPLAYILCFNTGDGQAKLCAMHAATHMNGGKEKT